jgi:hypothetical protein
MTTTAYYTALGAIINGILARVLKEVLGLRDIPEVESQRLAALCKILHPLDELFVQSADEVPLLYLLRRRTCSDPVPGFQRCRICAIVVKVYVSLRHPGAHCSFCFRATGNGGP